MNKESSALPLKGGEVDGIRVTNEIFQRLQGFGEVYIKKVDPPPPRGGQNSTQSSLIIKIQGTIRCAGNVFRYSIPLRRRNKEICILDDINLILQILFIGFFALFHIISPISL